MTGKNSFHIFGKNLAICMTIPLSKLIQNNLKSQQALLNVKFNYKSNLPLKFCLAKLINAACQSYRDNQLSTYFGLEDKDLETLGLQFQLDTTNSKTIEKALYENISLSLTYPSFSSTLSTLSTLSTFSTLSTSSALIVPFSGNEQLSADITKLPKTHGYCPNQPSNDRPTIKKEITDHFIRYISQVGTACDHFSYQNLSQNQAYLVAITSRNIKGLPLTICVANQISKHCDIYASLSSSRNFTTDIFLLPPYIKNESGFDVNIRNLGIKKTPAINDLKSIQIIPFPYKWLSLIRHSGNQSVDRRTEHPESEILKQVQNDKRDAGQAVRRPEPIRPELTASRRLTAEWASMTSIENNSSVLVLPQSFEKGWKAYRINVKCQMSNVKCFILSSFPFFFGKELNNHVLVNNWANGWILNNETMKQFNPEKIASQFNGAGNSTIVFLFLPQYLEYLGFVLLIGTIIYLVKTRSGSDI